MKETSEFDRELLEISGTLKGSYLFFINNAGKAIALITLAVAAVLIFADIGFTDVKSAAFTTMLVAMLASSYIIYFSLEDSGEKLGEQSEEYTEALAKYKTARSKISAEDINDLRAFCLKYSADELEYRRKNFIAEAGYSKEEYEEYKRGERKKLRERYYFSRAERMKAISLTPSLLLSGGGISTLSELENPEKRKLLYSFFNLLPSTLCMIFTVSVILTARGDLTASTIIDGLVKLSALPVIGFRGYSAGYSFVKDKRSVWIETKARLLEAFSDKEEKSA